MVEAKHLAIFILQQNCYKTICLSVKKQQDVSQEDLKEAENDVATVIQFLSDLESRPFLIPNLSTAKVNEVNDVLNKFSLTTMNSGASPKSKATPDKTSVVRFNLSLNVSLIVVLFCSLPLSLSLSLLLYLSSSLSLSHSSIFCMCVL